MVVYLKTIMLAIAMGFCVTMMISCATRQSQLGVENKWRSASAPVFHIGRTTQSDVMRALGPPSQVIALHGQTLFYYLREQQRSRSLFLLVYNQSREEIIYDRAIFFFNQDGILKDYALSDEVIPRSE
jgi:outer membrane protein assembly factor BamE (lipoprotein component of BamABCDE complex)